jgi:hypothetical protein
MGTIIDDKNVLFEGVIYEDDVVVLRDHLQIQAPEVINFNFKKCDDIHLAMLQLIFAYKKMYSCEYSFSDDEKLYKKVLLGFDGSEKYCN